jgi:LacI family transcriptional regulator
MDDVARHAGVSVSTVSHVLNRTRKVRPATAKAVEDAMREVGYTPNTIARALARSASNSIGVAISAVSNHYFSEVVRAIEAECARRNLMIFLSDTRDDPEHELHVVRALHQRRVDGIVLAPAADPQSRVLRYLQNNKIPAVLIDRLASRHFDQVGVENKRATAELVRHLAEHGHRRIAMISGLAGLTTTKERIDGYRAGLQAAGLEFEDALVVSGKSAIEPAMSATHELLGLQRPPTAIVTGNNLMTIGTMYGLRDAGLEVPRDMALVGFDDFDWADVFNPRLTVVAQPCEQLGVRAIGLLMRRLEEPQRKHSTVRIQGVLRIRNSCGCDGKGACRPAGC